MKTNVGIDLVLYLGDPDDGVDSVPCKKACDEFDNYRDKLPLDDVLYGAMVVTKDGKELGSRRPDPVIKLMTTLVRILPYLIEGEPETALLSETEHGYLIEPNNDQVMISMFAGSGAES